MSNDIGSFNAAHFNPYHRLNPSSSPAETEGSQAAEKTNASEKPDAAPASEAPSEMPDLSAAEQEMIQRQFPRDPDLSLRLYGPNRDTEQVNPGALGQNLDVRG